MPTAEEVLDGRPYAVIQADCLEWLPMLTGQVDHIVCDPPYETEAHTKQRRSLKDATQRKGAVNVGEVRHLDPVLPFSALTEDSRARAAEQFGRLSRRWVIAFCQAEAVGAWRSALEAGGLDWVRAGVWIKPNGLPQFTGDRPAQGFESLAIAHPPGRKSWNGGGTRAVWECNLDHSAGGGGQNEHPTTKPLALMLCLIELFTSPNDLILDPFLGSGTTALACLRANPPRRCIGIERSPVYAALARERLEAELSHSTLSARRAGQLPLLR